MSSRLNLRFKAEKIPGNEKITSWNSYELSIAGQTIFGPF